MHSERINETFLGSISKRLKLPLYFEGFMQIFKSQEKLSAKNIERKVFYSSLKRKKDERDYIDEE